ncbi:calcium/sodium antiporter [Halalkaliarchaeum sp. AArc-GB]|uniref:calcium/sodium antiporter n=1 Tax=unclassified Halalkaliarchaeum TaxID=2678344 RepID=UPI00217EBAC4|nr:MULTISPECIES: calcium/sodium antiporter [unclassified Halalkaliarchaeum]MDR5672262.1 calcium/sodium antiporter [Halalkaliarchaeum sp. AArc-GB]
MSYGALVSIETLFLVAGVLLLWKGADLLVTGAGTVALGFGLRRATVGVTVVAFATTAPELFVAVVGTVTATTDIGLGAVIGSNVANIGLVLGLAALIRPLPISETVFRRHVPFMVLAALLLVVLGANGRIGRLDGIVLLTVLAGFSYYIVRRVQAGAAFSPNALPNQPDPTIRDWAVIALGLVLLVLGSRWLIDGGRGILTAMGFSDLFVGLTVLAIGTSLPELAASIVSAYRDEAGFSVGNVVGSNIYNVLAVIGILAVVTPIHISPGVLTFEFPALVAFTLALVAMMWHGDRLSRLDGAVLLVGYVAFIWLLLP